MTRMPSILGSSAQSSGGSCSSDAGPAAGAGGYQGRVKVGMEGSDVGGRASATQDKWTVDLVFGTTWQRLPRSAAHQSDSVGRGSQPGIDSCSLCMPWSASP